jgi:hypothetical protein
VPQRALVAAHLTPLRSPCKSSPSTATRSSLAVALPVAYLTRAPHEARWSTALRLPRELVRTNAISAGRSHRCWCLLSLRRSSTPSSSQRSDTVARATQEHRAWAQLCFGPHAASARVVMGCAQFYASELRMCCATGPRAEFGPLAFVSFFYFLNIFKLLQVQKFVQVRFELRKL